MIVGHHDGGGHYEGGGHGGWPYVRLVGRQVGWSS